MGHALFPHLQILSMLLSKLFTKSHTRNKRSMGFPLLFFVTAFSMSDLPNLLHYADQLTLLHFAFAVTCSCFSIAWLSGNRMVEIGPMVAIFRNVIKLLHVTTRNHPLRSHRPKSDSHADDESSSSRCRVSSVQLIDSAFVESFATCIAFFPTEIRAAAIKAVVGFTQFLMSSIHLGRWLGQARKCVPILHFGSR